MVYRNDKISIREIEALKPRRLVISPGPCTPNEAGISVELFEQDGVDVVFSGDDHFYRHSLRNGIHYTITGGGGAPLHAVGTQMSGATLIYAESTYEYCIVDLTPTTFNLYAANLT